MDSHVSRGSSWPGNGTHVFCGSSTAGDSLLPSHWQSPEMEQTSAIMYGHPGTGPRFKGRRVRDLPSDERRVRDFGGPCFKTTILFYWTMSSLRNSWSGYMFAEQIYSFLDQTTITELHINLHQGGWFQTTHLSFSKRIKAQWKLGWKSYSTLEVGGIYYKLIKLSSFILPNQTKQKPWGAQIKEYSKDSMWVSYIKKRFIIYYI